MRDLVCSRSTLRGPGADSTNERPRTKRLARSADWETMARFNLDFFDSRTLGGGGGSKTRGFLESFEAIFIMEDGSWGFYIARVKQYNLVD